MKQSISKHFLKDERKRTDESLVAEREKTNESLLESKSIAEDQTDKNVQSERRQADQSISDSRIASGQLDIEAVRADKAVKLGRLQVDQALEKEREIKNELAHQLLAQERKLTDKSLSTERTKTDHEVQKTSIRLSEEIKEHSKTKTSLTTREELLAIASHDLKNPMGTASLCAEMLLANPTFQELGGDVRKSVELIKRNIDTSLRLIADILDMERIEGGKLQLSLQKQSLAEIVNESIEGFAPAALTKGISLSTITSGNACEVMCDKDRIMQVLSNLMSNALKFTPEGGKVTLQSVFNGAEAQISVCDSGPGIPEEKQSQIFERFAQLGVQDRDGLGLGLYISKMLINAHQGRLWVTSKVGEGSTFSFSIPCS